MVSIKKLRTVLRISLHASIEINENRIIPYIIYPNNTRDVYLYIYSVSENMG